MADPPKTRPYYPTSVKLPNLVAVRQKVRTYIEMSFARKNGPVGSAFQDQQGHRKCHSSIGCLRLSVSDP